MTDRTCSSLKCPAYTHSAITGRRTCATLRREVVGKLPEWCPRMRMADCADKLAKGEL